VPDEKIDYGVPSGAQAFFRAHAQPPFPRRPPRAVVRRCEHAVYEGKLGVRGDGTDLYFVTRGSFAKLAIHVA